MYVLRNIFSTPNFRAVLIQISKIVLLFNSNNGFGVFNVNGVNLFPSPAHNINAVLILI